MQRQINTQVLRLLKETTREVSVTAEVISEKDCPSNRYQLFKQTGNNPNLMLNS